MAGTGLEVRLHQGRDRAELSAFTRALDEVRLSLREIDEVYLERAPRPTWVVEGLKEDKHDLVVLLQARSELAKRSDLDMPVRALVDGARVLQDEPTVPEYFPPRTVDRLARLATPTVGIQGVSLAVSNGVVGNRIELNNAVRNNATAAIKQVAISYGSVTGRLTKLEKIERRQGGARITIRNGRQAIAGYVPADKTETLPRMWGYRVNCSGTLKRNASGQIIHIDVLDSLELMPEGNLGRPSSDELLGAAKGWLTEGQIDEYLRQLRRRPGDD